MSWNLTNLGGAPESVAAHYDVSLATLGLLGTSLFLGELLFIVPGGRLVDRIGPRRTGLACLTLAMVANAGILLAPRFVTASLLRFVVGAGVGAGFVAGASYVNAVGGSVLAQGLYGGTAIGVAGVSVAVVAFLEPIVGWHAPFLSGSVMALFGLLVLVASADTTMTTRVDRANLRDVVTDRRIWQFASAQAATFGMSVVLGNWAVPLLSRYGGYSQRLSGAIGGLILVAGVLGRPLGGVVATRWPERRRLLVAVSLAATSASCLLLLAPRPVVVALMATAGIGLAAGLAFGPLIHGVAQLRPDAPGSAIAAMNIPAVAGVMLAVPLFGATFSLPGGGRVGVIGSALLLALAIAVLPDRSVFSA